MSEGIHTSDSTAIANGHISVTGMIAIKQSVTELHSEKQAHSCLLHWACRRRLLWKRILSVFRMCWCWRRFSCFVFVYHSLITNSHMSSLVPQKADVRLFDLAQWGSSFNLRGVHGERRPFNSPYMHVIFQRSAKRRTDRENQLTGTHEHTQTPMRLNRQPQAACCFITIWLHSDLFGSMGISWSAC